MNSTHLPKMIPLLLCLLITCITTPCAATSNTDPYRIGCGIPKSKTATSTDNRVWRSDEDPAFAPPDINAVSSSISVFSERNQPPYTRTRIFKAPVTYSFPVSPGPKFLRLYFDPTDTTYPSLSQFFLSVEANGLTLLHNFSASLNHQDNYIPGPEFHLIVPTGTPLNLTFSPSNHCPSGGCYGFINGIEIIPVPEGLYFNATRNPAPSYVNNVINGYEDLNRNTAFQTVYRINVGGLYVDPVKDAGGLGWAWYSDTGYIEGGFLGTTTYQPPGGWKPKTKYTAEVPPYVAPGLVYCSERFIGLDKPKDRMSKNLTWRFDVDPGFDYLVRLHFCEMDENVTAAGQRVFQVYINNETAGSEVDVWRFSGGNEIPIFRDYVVSLYGESSNGTKTPLWLALHPVESPMENVLLNGLEILKLNQTNGNLAVPNPPSAMSPTPSPLQRQISNHHHSLSIIGGVVGGVILFSLLIFACLVRLYKQSPNIKKVIAKTLSLSLPSDLCRRFSLGEIRIATCDFDESSIIGTGGFGKVYKGFTDGGVTPVAIKRLNPTSNQGAREFRTEIEMLSRLRHMHLVSLIGYCEDQGEMILVYEYMPRGTLKDHLMYKKNNNTTPLSWKQRLLICIGSARGLHYLHTGVKHVIIHRDVKSTNILLDDKWTAKVSDFGISKVGPEISESGASHVSTAVKGSLGYLDPEYIRRQQLTEKSDVYSFGVVLFEVLCGRPAVIRTLPEEQVNLAVLARNRYQSGTLHTIVDPNLKAQITPKCLEKFGEIGEMCIREHGSQRPSMEDVVWGLEFALQLQETTEKDNIVFDGGPLLGPMDDDDDDDLVTTTEDNTFQSSVDGASVKPNLHSSSSSSVSSRGASNIHAVFSK